MIEMCLAESDPVTGSTSTETRYSYRVHVGTRRVHSELLRVNRESRQAASEFYRARVPCLFVEYGIEVLPVTGWEGCLAYNPEYDFLYITTRSIHLADFLYDLKTTYDPHHVGLRNLATEHKPLNLLLYSLDLPNQVDAKVRETVGDMLSQLRQVFVVSVLSIGRQVHRRLHGLLLDRDTFNRSYPIMAQTATFERLRWDPRDIAPDLNRILMSSLTCAPNTVQVWNQVLGRLEISLSHISYRLLLACEPLVSSCHRIIDHRSANTFLEREDEMWVEVNRDAQELDPLNDDLERAVRPAIGFWLFPIEALDAYEQKRGQWHEGAMLDLTKHWPELALLGL